MADNLKPCPFCGDPVSLEKAHQRRDPQFDMRHFWGVVCRNTTNLGGTCCMEQVPSASEEAAVERWNRRAAPPVGDDGLPPEDDRPERDWEKWIVGRGRLGPGAVPERIFFAGWFAGRRAAVPAQTGAQPAGDSVDTREFRLLLAECLTVTEAPFDLRQRIKAELARRAAVSTASVPEARQIFEHKRIGDFTVQVTFRSARACGKFVEWVAAPSSPVE